MTSRPDLQHRLHDPVGEDRQVDIGPEIAAPSRGAQGLHHRFEDRRRPLLGECGQFRIRCRRLVERHLQRGAMCDGALRDRRAQIHDPVERGQRCGIVQAALRVLGDAIQIVVIAPEQLDEDRFLGFEMVVEAAGENACGVGDLLQRGAQTRRRDQQGSGLQDLGAPGAVVVCVAGMPRRHLRTPHNTSTAPDSRPGFCWLAELTQRLVNATRSAFSRRVLRRAECAGRRAARSSRHAVMPSLSVTAKTSS